MEIFTTVILITLSFIFSIYLVTKGINAGKNSIDELKSGKN